MRVLLLRHAETDWNRERRFQAWVQVSMGCNSVCSYCIVPSVRGREQSRRPGEILAEVTQLAGAGIALASWGPDEPIAAPVEALAAAR